MSTPCPSPADLVLAALGGEASPADQALARHVRECPSCGRELAELREVIRELRSNLPESPAATPCLDDLSIAHLVDGVDAERDEGELRHLIACARCREEFAAAVRLTHDPLVIAEVERLVAPTPRRRHRRSLVAVAGGLAAAGLVGLLLWPSTAGEPVPELVQDVGALRERTITTTVAPRIVAPVDVPTGADSLRWTSVPTADLYRITIWNADGTVVWQGESRDTVHALPTDVTRSDEQFLLWEVKARTGWERWVVSDLVALTLKLPGVR